MQILKFVKWLNAEVYEILQLVCVNEKHDLIQESSTNPD